MLKQLEHARGRTRPPAWPGQRPAVHRGDAWVALTFLSEAVQAFRERMPEVRLELFESLMAVAQPLLRDGSMDFAIGPLHGAQAARSSPARSCSTTTPRCWSARHPLAGCGSIHELLEQDWALNYTGDGHDAPDARVALAPRRLDRRAAHHPRALRGDPADPGGAGRHVHLGAGDHRRRPAVARPGGAAGAAETFEPRRLGIITRRGGALSNPAQCFVECLLQVIRRHARSAKKDDRRLFETLRLLV
ncbi:LysR substrate-binding domain-containing protein [Pseudomonas aeruginosa]|nr:LysR substrate-binding domain-containing protein [Pseudomonas aeruginosa]